MSDEARGGKVRPAPRSAHTRTWPSTNFLTAAPSDRAHVSASPALSTTSAATGANPDTLMRAPKWAWAILIASIAAAGVALLLTTSLISGEHAHGHWRQPAKEIGLLLLLLAGLGLWLLHTGWDRHSR